MRNASRSFGDVLLRTVRMAGFVSSALKSPVTRTGPGCSRCRMGSSSSCACGLLRSHDGRLLRAYQLRHNRAAVDPVVLPVLRDVVPDVERDYAERCHPGIWDPTCSRATRSNCGEGRLGSGGLAMPTTL